MKTISAAFATSDHVNLHYLEAGAGRVLLFIPGWSQTATMFRPLIDDLSRDHRVVAIDMRGHGESTKPSHGYRIARLAKDLSEFLASSDFTDVTLIGHSMGCAVIWSFLELHDTKNISRLVFIDQAPVVTAWPGWSENEKALSGALHDAGSLFEAVSALSGPDGPAVTAEYVRNRLFTRNFPAAGLDWVVSENLKLPRDHAARLLLELAAHDWRDAIRRITLPTMIFAGRASIFHPASQEWIARQIPGACIEIFDEDEGGSHFMWLENPAKFTCLLRNFLCAA
jgi:pimeloyl-ACP methyl ester carboxylesterase